MKQRSLMLLAALCCFCAASAFAQDPVVVRDADTVFSRDELAAIIATMPSSMREAATNDRGDLLEVLNTLTVTKRMAAQADAAPAESLAFWQLMLKINNLKQRYVLENFRAGIEFPDFEQLARERYQAQKDEYALVPEHRKVSHILLFCPPGCDREPLRPKADDIHQRLLAGEPFEELVEQYSEDQASKAKQGMFDRWFKLGDPEVEPHFTGAAFELDEVGDVSPVVDTPFGLHIIRLDGVEPPFYREYAEVSDRIISELKAEYRSLKEKEFLAQFQLSPEVELDMEALQQLFSDEQPSGDS